MNFVDYFEYYRTFYRRRKQNAEIQNSAPVARL